MERPSWAMGTSSCWVCGAAVVHAGDIRSSKIAAPAAASTEGLQQPSWAKGHGHPGVPVALGSVPVNANLWVDTYKLILIEKFLKGLGEDMEEDNRTETWHQSLQAVLNALNQTLHGVILCPADRPAATSAATRNASTRASRAGRNDNAYMYILFVMTLFAATVGSLILGYTRSRKVDKRSDPYHVYIKNRVSMI
ncbi:potassium voltage-gated channel subfamily E member 3 [Larus michahellis]|uniref:potassium voltage-gated channel subfamily E member 3 n=1 Tax=Larus michahellis TaxID=119627 RepID=UPI003D9BF831